MKIINIKTIRIDGGTQSRVEINNDIVTEYAQAIQAGAEFPAVVVFNDGVDNWLADGFHRFHAHGQAGKTSIQADMRTGTVRDAKLFSFGANGRHGQRPTNSDKRKSVSEMLADSEWATWSQHKIAETCGVSAGFVSKMVAEAASIHGEQIKPANRTVERNGKTYEQNTANIGKPRGHESPKLPTEQVAEPEAADPEPEDHGPSPEEIAANHASELADRALMATLLESDAPLALLVEENKQLRAEISQLKQARDGYMNRCNEAIALVKSRDRQIAKMEKSMRDSA